PAWPRTARTFEARGRRSRGRGRPRVPSWPPSQELLGLLVRHLLHLPDERALDRGRELLDGRLLEEGAQGEIHAERPADPRDELCGKERMSPGCEEIVPDPHALPPQDLAPGRRQGFLHRR